MNKHSQLKIAPAAGLLPKTACRDFARDLDLSDSELIALLDLAARVKRSPGEFAHALSGKYICLLFEKPSLRTRLTFELAIKQLGGDAVFCDGPIGAREPLQDVARNLDRWVQAIVVRSFLQTTIDELAHWSAAPVINALSDRYHPCQALADMFTVKERFGDLFGLKMAFIGDGNNVAHSLMLDASRFGMRFAIATPKGYEPDAEIVAQARELARVSGARLEIGHDPADAAAGAHAVYTDVWASMGQEKEAAARRKKFQAFQVTEELLDRARPDAVFMHCLPAKRGEETTGAVMESPRSVVFDQAENRLHAQKALLLMMLA